MEPTPTPLDVLVALRTLTLDEIEQRLVALDAERAALSLLRRSLAARDRAVRRASRHRPTGGHADAAQK
jgi:hypothetical protein